MRDKKIRGIGKGTLSGFLISILLHAAAFMLAGLLVVFTVVKKEEKKFVPPKPVERPKIKLKKPKVKLKKSAKPKSSERIVTKDTRANMPDLQLPEMGGIGDGIGTGEGVGGFNLMPDLSEVSMFGETISIGNDLEGVFYDLKRYQDGRSTGIFDAAGLKNIVEKFIRSGWKTSVLSRYYHSPKKLYTTMVMVPPTESSLGPWAFGESDMGPWCYLIHYKGQMVHRDGIKFRFVVMGDNYLLIRLGGKVVMDYKNQFGAAVRGPQFKAMSYHLGHWFAYGSDWITLEPGVPQEIEVITGDFAGGLFACMIAVEEYGVDYPSAPVPQDNPQLPIFKTAPLSIDQIDAVYQRMWEGHLQLTNGPVFSDYDSGARPTTNSVVSLDSVVEPELVTLAMEAEAPARHVWTFANGKSIEAEYIHVFGGKVVLKTGSGKMIKLLPEDFSAADRDRLQLLNPPKLKLSFKRDTSSSPVRNNPDKAYNPIPVATVFTGGVVIEQEDRQNDYRRPLRLEFYVIADSYDGDNFILYDRQVADFTLTPENKRRFELNGRKDIMLRYQHYSGKIRGEKYKGYMILVFNERDEIISQNLSHEWLLDIRDELLKFPVGRYFNTERKRVHPPRPIFTDTYWDALP